MRQPTLSHRAFLIATVSSVLCEQPPWFSIHQSYELTCSAAQLFRLSHAAGSGIIPHCCVVRVSPLRVGRISVSRFTSHTQRRIITNRGRKAHLYFFFLRPNCCYSNKFKGLVCVCHLIFYINKFLRSYNTSVIEIAVHASHIMFICLYICWCNSQPAVTMMTFWYLCALHVLISSHRSI